jgi:UDP-N-acetylmuramoyl-tripeptide--D-alanyl-D-alanine ligase
MLLLKSILIHILTTESKLILRKYKPFIVAITGSVGKTSTKDAVYDVLKTSFKYVRKSEKSMNSEIGLPLTVIGVPNAWKNIGHWFRNIFVGLELLLFRDEYPECLVLEIGADHPGDIERVTKWMKPDISIITRVSTTPVHVEFFSSPMEVFKEKSFLAKAVKSGGTLILYGDAENTVSLLNLKDTIKDLKVITFGINTENLVRGDNINVQYDQDGKPTGINFNIITKNETGNISLQGVLSKSYIYSILAGVSAGVSRNMPMKDILVNLGSFKYPPGRMNIIKGLNNSIIIDDSYNSSPDAVESAIETIKSLNTNGRKIVALGDMMELGQYSADEHRKVGKLSAQGIDIIVTVGQRSRLSLVAGLNETNFPSANIHSFDNSIEAGEFLKTIVNSGDIVLVKGSQSTRMEKVVKTLLTEPARAGELLVRQEKEWLER